MDALDTMGIGAACFTPSDAAMSDWSLHWVNASLASMLGSPQSYFQNASMVRLTNRITPDFAELSANTIANLAAQQRPMRSHFNVYRGKSGERFSCWWSSPPLVPGELTVALCRMESVDGGDE